MFSSSFEQVFPWNTALNVLRLRLVINSAKVAVCASFTQLRLDLLVPCAIKRLAVLLFHAVDEVIQLTGADCFVTGKF